MSGQSKLRQTLITSLRDFNTRVGLIQNYQEIERLGLVPRSMEAMFFSRDVATILNFCTQNQEYHVVTCTDGYRLENRYIPGYSMYHLAKGDKDPGLVFNWRLNPNRHLEHEIFIDELEAVLSDIKRRR